MSIEFPKDTEQPEGVEGLLERSEVAVKIKEAFSREKDMDEEDFNVAPETREEYGLFLRWCKEQEAKAKTDRERLQFEIERVRLYMESGMPKAAFSSCEQSLSEIDYLEEAGVDISDRIDLVDELEDLYHQLQ